MKIFKRLGSWNKMILTIMSLSFVLLSWSCYPDGGFSSLADYDLIVTQYDPEVDFSTYSTYVIPDSIIHIVPEDQEDDITHEFDDQILAEVEDNMSNLGYSKVDTSENPNLTVLVYATSTTWRGYTWYPGWGYWGWWGYYPPYWGPGYGGWAVPYEYTTGTLAIEMIDNSTFNPADSTYQANWGAGILGLLDDSKTNIEYRLTRDIDQAFKQSPYLGSD